MTTHVKGMGWMSYWTEVRFLETDAVKIMRYNKDIEIRGPHILWPRLVEPSLYLENFV